jgi:23S rRNA pseudouridine2457 synthase
LSSSHHHYVLFKPWGYLSQFINNSATRRNKKLLGELGNFHVNTMAIGRLDQDSEGLLFLTTDGAESYRITSEKFEKEYYVQLDGVITDEAIQQLRDGVSITVEGKAYLTKPCKADRITTPTLPARGKKIRDERHGPTSWASITLREGKYRQVRKMTAAVGFPTLRLVRYRIGTTNIGNMNAGDWFEVDHFFDAQK